ncbi:MAG: hypothetical protein ACO201_05770 [Rickettsiales bacterium]
MNILGFLGSLFDLNNTQDKKDNPIQNPAPTLRNLQPKPSQGPLNNPPKDDFLIFLRVFFHYVQKAEKIKNLKKT